MKKISLIAMLLLSSLAAFGQNILATVTGTISDATGAVIADVPVTVRNLENGQVYVGGSSSTGNYTVSQLPIGDYDLTVSSPGFKTYTHTRFHLAAGQTMREDITLEVGQTAESVTVTADASLLKTETTEVGQNVTLSQLNNLPILSVGTNNSGFRDPFAATRLVPGVRYGPAAAAMTIVVNGTPANTLQTRLDGMTINPTSARLLGANMQTQPSVDAIEEVAIQTSNFAAEYGAAGGAMVNMVSKSGTNQFHGTVYDYATNEALNAHQPYTGIRNKVRQTDWGFTAGGPVWIPKVYDGRNKTFFFWSFEQYRNKNIITNGATTVPVPAYREGDFSSLITLENRLITRAQGATSIPALDDLGRQMQSGTIFDPRTTRPGDTGRNVRDAFVGNRIPSNLFDPISMKVLALIPQPLGVNAENGQASNNYQAPYDTSRRSEIPSIKIDHNLNDKGRLSFYLQETRTNTPRTATGADAFPDLITASVSSRSAGTTARVNYDYTVTPRLLLHLGAGWNDSDFKLVSAVIDYNTFQELGLTGQTLVRNFPRITAGVNGNSAIGGMSSIGTTTQESYFERRPSGNVSGTYVTGGHTVKFGAEYRLEKFPNYPLANTNGTFSFGPNYTEQPSLQGITTNQGFDGFEFASFLLGGMSSNSQAAPAALSTSKSQWGMFLQDNWKVTRKLTLDYGVRWDLGTYAREHYGRNASFGTLVPNPAASGRLGGRQYEATCNCSFADNYPYAIGPRIGVAYNADNKTVIRGGIGVVYNATSVAAGSFVNSASSSAIPANSGGITGLFQNGMPESVRAQWPTFEANAGQGVGTVVGMPLFLDPNAGRPARLLQWNISVQREVHRDLIVEVAYVGNRGTWWTANDLPTVNFFSQDLLQQYGFTNLTSLAESQLLTTIVGNLTPAQRTTLQQRGVPLLPYANFPTTGATGQTVRQALLPFPQYSQQGTGATASMAGAPLGKTWYDAFQLNVTQRLSHGLSFNMNYNFSKNLDQMSSPDVFNRQLGKNLSVWDLPHQLRLTAQYQVPSLSGKGMGVLSNKVVSYILADWGLGVYLNYQSAALVGRPTSSGAVGLNQFLGRGPGGAQLKKDADGNYMNPWSVDWYDYDGNHRTDPLNINCKCFDPTKTIVLNPNAWENIPDGQWGADQSSLRFYRGFRAPTENANFSRNFRMGPEGKYNLNIRVEFNNVFNRMLYSTLGTPINLGNFASAQQRFGNDPITGLPTRNTGLYSSGFGTVVPVAGTGGSRTGTFVARFTF